MRSDYTSYISVMVLIGTYRDPQSKSWNHTGTFVPSDMGSLRGWQESILEVGGDFWDGGEMGAYQTWERARQVEKVSATF